MYSEGIATGSSVAIYGADFKSASPKRRVGLSLAYEFAWAKARPTKAGRSPRRDASGAICPATQSLRQAGSSPETDKLVACRYGQAGKPALLNSGQAIRIIMVQYRQIADREQMIVFQAAPRIEQDHLFM